MAHLRDFDWNLENLKISPVPVAPIKQIVLGFNHLPIFGKKYFPVAVATSHKKFFKLLLNQQC